MLLVDTACNVPPPLVAVIAVTHRHPTTRHFIHIVSLYTAVRKSKDGKMRASLYTSVRKS